MSDEIPVGSPPAPRGRHAAPGGWYLDPVDQQRERYWDGWQWSRNVRPVEGRSPAPQQSPPPIHQPGMPGPGPVGPPVGGPGHTAYRIVPATADGVPLAAWGWRVLAFTVDYFVIYAVTQIIAAVTPIGAGVTRATNAYSAYLTEVLTTGSDLDFAYAIGLMNTPAVMALNVLTIVLFIVYSALMLRARGATLGKMLFRLRVVPLDQGRSGPGLIARTAWLRPLVEQLLGLVALLGLVNYLFPLWDRRRQTLHDKVVHTQVVRDVRR